MSEQRTCKAGHVYQFPEERWAHDFCAAPEPSTPAVEPIPIPFVEKPVFRTPEGKFDRKAYMRWYMRTHPQYKPKKKGLAVLNPIV